MSSPMPRCVDTAKSIMRGAEWSGNVTLDRRLGVPGPFVVDPALAGALFLELSSIEVVRSQLSDEKSLPGMRSTSEGVEILLDLASDNLQCRGRLNVYVTHDAILAVVVARLFHMPMDEEGWPDYLDGLLMWRSSSRLKFAWRGLQQTSHPIGR